MKGKKGRKKIEKLKIPDRYLKKTYPWMCIDLANFTYEAVSVLVKKVNEIIEEITAQKGKSK